MLNPSNVVQGLGMAPSEEAEWATYIGQQLSEQPTELTYRQAIISRALSMSQDPVVRRIIVGRALRLWREDHGLEKAEARGGKYHRRVPLAGGGYRYVYRPEDYDRRADAHVSGDEATSKYVAGRVAKCVEAAGGKGLAVDGLKSLVQRHGHKVVARALNDHVASGAVSYKRGKFYASKKVKDQ